MKKLLALFLIMFSSQVVADALGVRITGGIWDTDISGNIRDSTNVNDTVDVKSDLFLDGGNQTFYDVYIEHFIPLIPNIRLGRTTLDMDGSGTVSKTFTYNGQTFTANDNLSTDLKLDHTDITLYWRLLDNVVNFDLGINAKIFDSEIIIKSNTNSALNVTGDFNETVPMLYLAAAVDLPLSGLSFGGAGSFITINSDSISDIMFYIRYETEYFVGVEGGYRSFSIDIDDTNDSTDPTRAIVDIDGLYIHAFLHF